MAFLAGGVLHHGSRKSRERITAFMPTVRPLHVGQTSPGERLPVGLTKPKSPRVVWGETAETLINKLLY